MLKTTTYIYVDDSIHERGNFIISGIVVTSEDIEKRISDCLILNGYNPEKDEFKSGLSFRKHPKMLNVRNELKVIISSACKIGLIVLPSIKRQHNGFETLKGLKKMIDSNDFEGEIKIFIDENYFKNEIVGKKFAERIGLLNCTLELEVDSKVVKGIQLADLVAHTCSTMLLEQLNLIDKKVRSGENSGYDPELEVELGFELWASIRYCFLGVINEDFLNGIGEQKKMTEPFGLYISDYCDKVLREKVKDRFSEIYMGCIH